MAPTPATMVVKLSLDTAEFDRALADAETRLRTLVETVVDRRIASVLGDMLGNLEGDEFAAFRSAIAPWLVKIGGRS